MDGLRCGLCGVLYEKHSILFKFCDELGPDKFTPKLSFDAHGNRVNPDGSLWNLDGKLAARNGNE